MKRVARWLRDLADRIDYDGAPRPTQWSFTYEAGRGPVFWQDGPGCRLWRIGHADYLRAHYEAGPAPGTGGQWQRGHRHPYLKEGPES